MSVSMMDKEGMDRRGLCNPSVRLAVVSGGAQVQSCRLSNLADSAGSGSRDETGRHGASDRPSTLDSRDGGANGSKPSTS